MGIGELLTIILALAKMTGYATIGWFTVFLPMIIIYGLVLVMFILYLIVMLLMMLK